MAIFTRMGTPVDAIAGETTDGSGVRWVRCKLRGIDTRDIAINDLRADDGIREIEAAIDAAKQLESTPK